mmetsp:Transcript_14559/g.14190  ORF Transcript_14559/g.14190 Transcript_14559/m.14190 type:complete len:116 (+) Transcript_14559:387-734(+)
MQENYNTMIDFLNVLENVKDIIPQMQGGHAISAFQDSSLMEEEKMGGINDTRLNETKIKHGETHMDGGVSIAYVAGTIEMEEKERLKKLVFRVTRGKALTYFREFDVPQKRVKGV